MYGTRRFFSAIGALLLALVVATSAQALDFSFTGSFTQDDDVQLFVFSVGATSNVTLRAWSYAGGTNAAGQIIPSGGFDTILALWDAGGNLIAQNDDGGCSLVGADPATGMCWDTYLGVALGAGNYQISIQQFDNFAYGPTLANGFGRDGQGNFTNGFDEPNNECTANRFIDVSWVHGGRCRTANWAFDILGVEEATVVPEPGTLLLLGSGLLGAAAWRRKRGGVKR